MDIRPHSYVLLFQNWLAQSSPFWLEFLTEFRLRIWFHAPTDPFSWKFLFDYSLFFVSLYFILAPSLSLSLVTGITFSFTAFSISLTAKWKHSSYVCFFRRTFSLLTVEQISWYENLDFLKHSLHCISGFTYLYLFRWSNLHTRPDFCFH